MGALAIDRHNGDTAVIEDVEGAVVVDDVVELVVVVGEVVEDTIVVGVVEVVAAMDDELPQAVTTITNPSNAPRMPGSLARTTLWLVLAET